ncbi:hypothetical protein Bca4012_024877 [Brassica carinata]
MSRSDNSEYSVPNLSGDNYVVWTMNTSGTLKSRGLWECVKFNNDTIACERQWASNHEESSREESRTMYKYIKDPHDLWYSLNNKYSESVVHEAEREWRELRFQDYESVGDYHSDLMRITYTLNLCGELITNEDKLVKTRETIHPQDVMLSYHASMCTTYFDLLNILLAVEKKEQEESEWSHVDSDLDLFIE